MTETLVGVSPPRTDDDKSDGPAELSPAELDAVRQMVKTARSSGAALTGPDGLLKALTKLVVESALQEEMTEHLGYEAGDITGRNGGNSRNGLRTKTVITDTCGPVTIEVPRDREGTFDPVVVPKRARRLPDLDTVVLSLSA